MAAVVTRFIAYFIQGVKDFLYGFYKIYEFRQPPPENDHIGEQVKQSSVLAQRRGVLAQRRGVKAQPAQKEKDSRSSIMSRVLECSAFNGIACLGSFLAFEYLLLPLLQLPIVFLTGNLDVYNFYVEPLVRPAFNALWVLPLFITSKLINSMWFQDIADSAWDIKRRKSKLPGFSMLLADLFFSIFVQTIVLLQTMLFGMFPLQLIGSCASLLHLSLLYSMYSFEYKWINMGWNIKQRIADLESRWPYHLGFGLPLAYMTWICPNVAVSGAVFSLFFPGLIISANEAFPIKERFDFSLHIFTAAVEITDFVFRTVAYTVNRKLSRK